MSLKKKKQMSTALVLSKTRKKKERLTKTPEERLVFLKEVAKFRGYGYKNKEIAEFYGITQQVITAALKKVRSEGLEIYQKDRIGLVEDQLLEIDALTQDALEDLESEGDVDLKIKLRKEVISNLTYKAKLQGLLIDKIDVQTNQTNPSTLLLQQFNVYEKENPLTIKK